MTKVIVVDDDITNGQLLQMLLELDGFVVSSCTNIEEALAATESDTDAFVVDWHLERNTSGLDLLLGVRAGQTKAANDTLIIMTSGDYRREEEAMEADANHFMLKPYPPDELSTTLRQMLSMESG